MRQIYYYQQSYFKATLQGGIIPRLSFKDSPPSSESYCIDTLWKSKDDTLNLGFSEADDQPNCVGSLPIDEDDGLSFEAYKWVANEAYSCKLLDASTCELNCDYLSGHFNTDDGNCYELKAVQKLCIKIDFKYMDGLTAQEALYVSDVKVTTGCFVGGSVASMQTVPLTV